MNSSSIQANAATRHPLLWISAGVLVAHAVVLQAMPSNTPGQAKEPTLVFDTRTISPPAPATPADLPTTATPQPAATTPLRLGPAKRAVQQTRTSTTEAEVATGTNDAQILRTSLSDNPIDNHTDSPSPAETAATEAAPHVATETAENASDTTEAAEQALAALSGQHILVATADATPRQRSHKAATSPAPVQIPAPQRLAFDVTGQAKKFQYRANAELLWQHDGQHYQAQQEIKVLLLGSRKQSSHGNLTPQGLQPLQFTDSSRREQTAQFDHAAGVVRFSHPEATAQALLPGMQDRLSVFIQLGALLAAAPERYPNGTQIHITTVGGRNALRWSFRIEGPETLTLPDGPLTTLKLQRLPNDAQDNEQQAQLWLAPSLGYLPARIRLTQDQGDFVDLHLRSHSAP